MARSNRKAEEDSTSVFTIKHVHILTTQTFVYFVRFSEKKRYLFSYTALDGFFLMTETQFLDSDVRTSFEENYINFLLQGVMKNLDVVGLARDRRRYNTQLFSENLKDLGIDGAIILNWILINI